MNEMPNKLTTRRQAIKYLRENTGLSYATCTSAINTLRATPDGERWKVFEADVKRKAIELTQRPDTGIRPVSAARKAQIMAEMRLPLN